MLMYFYNDERIVMQNTSSTKLKKLKLLSHFQSLIAEHTYSMSTNQVILCWLSGNKTCSPGRRLWARNDTLVSIIVLYYSTIHSLDSRHSLVMNYVYFINYTSICLFFVYICYILSNSINNQILILLLSSSYFVI